MARPAGGDADHRLKDAPLSQAPEPGAAGWVSPRLQPLPPSRFYGLVNPLLAQIRAPRDAWPKKRPADSRGTMEHTPLVARRVAMAAMNLISRKP
jgi:hypothetical protein